MRLWGERLDGEFAKNLANYVAPEDGVGISDAAALGELANLENVDRIKTDALTNNH